MGDKKNRKLRSYKQHVNIAKKKGPYYNIKGQKKVPPPTREQGASRDARARSLVVNSSEFLIRNSEKEGPGVW